jgi:hypothetical protein
MIDVLVQNPERWSRIYALSRRPPQADAASTTLQHVGVDLLNEPQDTAQTLSEHNVQA